VKVQDVITGNVKSCRPGTNLAAAAVEMWENDCGALPVVDGEGRVIGLITDRDIAIAVGTRGSLASELAVGDVISGRAYCCTLDEDLKTALKTMRQEKVRRLPVVDDSRVLQGILSLNDVVLRAEESKGKRVPELSYEDVISTIKAICEHRSSEETGETGVHKEVSTQRRKGAKNQGDKRT
jgi:CBS domain-containing protein